MDHVSADLRKYQESQDELDRLSPEEALENFTDNACMNDVWEMFGDLPGVFQVRIMRAFKNAEHMELGEAFCAAWEAWAKDKC